MFFQTSLYVTEHLFSWFTDFSLDNVGVELERKDQGLSDDAGGSDFLNLILQVFFLKSAPVTKNRYWKKRKMRRKMFD